MKFTVNGETFSSDWEPGHVSMADALAIEKAANRRYVEWETEFLAGSAEALAAFVVLAWQRDGRDVSLQDVLDGKAELDFSETFSSVMRALTEQARARAENPTSGAAPLTAPDGTPTMPGATSEPSPKSSVSGRGKSGG